MFCADVEDKVSFIRCQIADSVESLYFQDGIVVLGRGELTKSLTVKACRFSKSAKEKITAKGGKAEVI